MLAGFIFVLLAGLIVGGLMARNSIGEKGWILLTGPMTALLVGLPVALIFSYWLDDLPNPWLGLRGAWRAIAMGSILGLIAGIALTYLSRNPRRRRDGFELAGPMILFTLVGSTLGIAWGLVSWVLD
jgi:Na+-driven multidrug efflux pump